MRLWRHGISTTEQTAAPTFFTEGSLGTAATQAPLRLDDLYGCLVTSDVERATRFVRSLG